MMLDFAEYNKVFSDKDIILVYSGPLWSAGIYGMAEMFRQHLDLDNNPSSETTAVFAIFVEQLNNMVMYSAEKIKINHPDGDLSESPKGSFVLGKHEGAYFIHTGNLVSDENAETLKKLLEDYNARNKDELLQAYKEKVKSGDMDTQGAGIGLLEIAWRCASLEYALIPHENGSCYFTMTVTVKGE